MTASSDSTDPWPTYPSENPSTDASRLWNDTWRASIRAGGYEAIANDDPVRPSELRHRFPSGNAFRTLPRHHPALDAPELRVDCASCADEVTFFIVPCRAQPGPQRAYENSHASHCTLDLGSQALPTGWILDLGCSQRTGSWILGIPGRLDLGSWPGGSRTATRVDRLSLDSLPTPPGLTPHSLSLLSLG